MFFVVSGFLITGLLLAELEREGRVLFADFYARRIRRLLPALTVVIVATLAIGAFVLLPWQERQLGKSSIAAAVFGSNIYFWRALRGYFGLVQADQPLLHTWSLGVEEQFYLLWPAGLALAWSAAHRLRLSRAKTLGVAMAAVGVVSFLFALRFGHSDPSGAFYLLPTRLWELAAGGVLALWRPHLGSWFASLLGAAGIGAVVAVAVTSHGTSGWPGTATLPLVLGTAAVIAAGPGPSPVNRVLGTKPFAFVGRLSYSWYLWHFPLLVLVRVDTLRTDRLRDTGIALAALGLAWLTYVLVEQPVRTQRIGALRRRTVTFALGIVLMGVGAAAGLAALETPRGAIERARSTNYGCLVVLEAAPIRVPSQCVPVQGRHGTLVLVGDSHAAALQPAFEVIARRLGLRLEVGTRASCPFLPGIGGTCDASYAASLADVIRQGGSVRLVVVHNEAVASLTAKRSNAAWRQAIRAPAIALAAHGIPVLYVLPTPDPDVATIDGDVPACLARRSASACRYPRALAVARRQFTAAAQRAAATEPLDSAWDPLPFFCGATLCRVQADGTPLYRDGHHLSIAGSELLVPQLLPVVRKAMRAY